MYAVRTGVQPDKIEPYIKMIDKTVRNPRTGGIYG